MAGAIGAGISWRGVSLVLLGGTGDESTLGVEGTEVVPKRATVTGKSQEELHQQRCLPTFVYVLASNGQRPTWSLQECHHLWEERCHPW